MGNHKVPVRTHRVVFENLTDGRVLVARVVGAAPGGYPLLDGLIEMLHGLHIKPKRHESHRYGGEYNPGKHPATRPAPGAAVPAATERSSSPGAQCTQRVYALGGGAEVSRRLGGGGVFSDWLSGRGPTSPLPWPSPGDAVDGGRPAPGGR